MVRSLLCWTSLLASTLCIGQEGVSLETCLACHGRDGISQTRQWPSLAGLGRDYIIKQMLDYASGQRIHPVMNEIAKGISLEQSTAIATALDGFEAKPAVAENELGRTIYQRGLPQRGIPPCQACHGAQGTGHAPLAIPGLAGQRGEYLKRQLLAFRKGTRHNDGGTMKAAVALLDYAEIKAVVDWLAGDYPRIL